MPPLIPPTIMLSKKQIVYITERVNEKINIPVIGEKIEFLFIRFAVEMVDEKMEEILPPEIAGLLTSISNGIDPQEAEELKKRMVKYLNNHVNITLLNEESEAKVIELFMDVLADSFLEGNALPQ